MIESEKKLERELPRRVKLAGGWCLKLVSIHINGLPDRLCLFPGAKLVFVELKTTKKKPSKLQRLIHRKLESLGFAVYIIDTLDGVKKLIEQHG